jgi:hypothetical protein
VLAVTAQIRTSGTPERIAEFLTDVWSEPVRRMLHFDRVSKAERCERYGAPVVEAFFYFTTHVGQGNGASCGFGTPTIQKPARWVGFF